MFLHAFHQTFHVVRHAFDLEFVAVGDGKDGLDVVVAGDDDEAAAVAGYHVEGGLDGLGGDVFTIPDNLQRAGACLGGRLRGEYHLGNIKGTRRRNGRGLQQGARNQDACKYQ